MKVPAIPIPTNSWIGAPLHPAEARIAQMDELDIDVQILSLSGPIVERAKPPDALARAANDVLAEPIQGHPDRSVSLVPLVPDLVEESAAELERCVTKLGFRGANLISHVGTPTSTGSGSGRSSRLRSRWAS